MCLNTSSVGQSICVNDVEKSNRESYSNHSIIRPAVRLSCLIETTSCTNKYTYLIYVWNKHICSSVFCLETSLHYRKVSILRHRNAFSLSRKTVIIKVFDTCIDHLVLYSLTKHRSLFQFQRNKSEFSSNRIIGKILDRRLSSKGE